VNVGTVVGVEDEMGVAVRVWVDVGGTGVSVGAGMVLSSQAHRDTASMKRTGMRWMGGFIFSSWEPANPASTGDPAAPPAGMLSAGHPLNDVFARLSMR
jgi:hypothetical protein